MTEQRQEFMAQFIPVERSIRALLLASTGDMNLADDLMQNVAVALWKKWPDYRSERPFRSWAFGVARIEILRWRRSASRDRIVLDVQLIDQLVAAADQKADESDQRIAILSQCLKEIKGDSKEVLTLKYDLGMRCCQIAEKIGKGVGAVEMMLTRTRRALRKCIKRKMAEA